MDPTTNQWRPDNTAAVLGKVSHSLMAACYRGDFVGVSPDNLERLIEDKWDQLMATSIIDLNKNPILAAIPGAERWPGYYQKQVQAIRKVLQVINSYQASKTKAGGPLVEHFLKPSDNLLQATVDRVEFSDQGVGLVDIKTSKPDPSDGPPESYRDQLLLYAYCWWKVEGKWPDFLRVDYLNGTSYSIPVDKQKATEIANDADLALQEFNSTSIGDHENNATPSAEACKWCEFRAVCNSFIDHSASNDSPDDHGEWVSDMRGVITESRPDGSITMKCDWSTSGEDKVKISRIERSYLPREGATVSVGNARRRRGANFSVDWNSVIWHWA